MVTGGLSYLKSHLRPSPPIFCRGSAYTHDLKGLLAKYNGLKVVPKRVRGVKGNLFEISVPDNTMKLVLSSAFLRVVRNLKDMDESKRRAAGRPLQGTGLTKSYLKTEMKKGKSQKMD